MRTVFAVEVLMLLHVRNIPLALGEQLCDILCGVLFGFIETRAARKRIANFNVDAVRNAVAAAIEAGWNPTSRGKPVVFDVDADGR